MNQLSIVNKNGSLLADSRQIAEMTGVRHSDLLEKIQTYIKHLTNGEFRSSDFFIESSYIDNKGESRPCYDLTKIGCDMIANKMTGEKGVHFTATYSIRFSEMEQQLLLPQVPTTLTGALRLAADLSEKNEQITADNQRLSLVTTEQHRRLKEQEAPVAIYNLAISAQNTMSMQEVAKSLGTGRTKLYQILREEEVIMKNSTLPYQRYIDAGHFKVTERPRASGDIIVNDPATRVTAKGFDFIARLLKRRSERLAKRNTAS